MNTQAEDRANHMKRLEGRSLIVGMWGNLFMGIAGVAAAILSNSDAILVDGLFSLIGFTAAILGRRVSQTAEAGPDRIRPAGYAADEAIFTTFRSLSLLGLVLFAITGAIMNIVSYASGGAPKPLVFGPLIIYFAVIGVTCFLLWGMHKWAWSRTGKKSDILRLEATAAAFDGVITAAAGIGMVGIVLLQDTALSFITPIGDSIIVLILCSTVVTRYFSDFMKGLGELAGVTADPEHIAKVRRTVRPALAEAKGVLTDLSVMKLGRTFVVTVYYNPGRPVTAAEVDTLTLRLEHELAPVLSCDVFVLPSEYGRRWPDDLNPKLNPKGLPEN
ncbi:cation transporter [Falsiruegeria mediterranea]|uniref:cation transporter n=1 Tax=Falsiruegeria mediterranea TaxID=1280832 RepID=UPI0015F28B5B|nr:cation transporter [Falsiruegeria mediterranea]